MHNIVAISTPTGVGAISIVRLTGDDPLSIVSSFFSTSKLSSFKKAKPNVAYVGKFKSSFFSDVCICIYFKAPHSYTGEDMVEIQCHGGTKVAQKILNSLLSAGATPAQRGEFTKRAFLNGKLSLSDAEGIIDMINAQSSAAVLASASIADGSFSKSILDYQNSIKAFIAELETSLDYPDEYGDFLISNISSIENIASSLETILESSINSSFLKNGINIAIVGPPNAGKSSLLNSFLGQEKSIVTNIPGTTRDVVEGRLEYKNILFNFYDTAGIHESKDEIESIGISKSYKTASLADLILVVIDSTQNVDSSFFKKMLAEYSDKKLLFVLNKIDLDPTIKEKDLPIDIKISVKTGEGCQSLLDLIYNSVISQNIDSSGSLLLSLRIQQAVQEALSSLKDFLAFDVKNSPVECAILDLKTAYFSLGLITGETANESIIDEIFNSFCVGK